MISVSVIEDDPAYRASLVTLLRASPDLVLLDVCESAEVAREKFLARPPQVALCDIQLPGITGVTLVSELSSRLTETAFLMLTINEDDDSVFTALESGATGYLLKGEMTAESLLANITDAHRGGSPMSWSIARRVVRSFSRPPQSAPEVAALSPRERQVLDQLALGLAYKQIAARLGVAEDTVRVHIRNLYAKLQVNSRAEAVRKQRGRS
jgi:DNA-binding NarL/FixJ family response regulator